jgi:hypothetical protein
LALARGFCTTLNKAVRKALQYVLLRVLLTQHHAKCCLQVYDSIASWAPYELLERMLYPETRQQPQQQQQQPPSIRQEHQELYSAPADLQSQQQQQQCVVRLPHVLIRAALHDAEVPIDNPVKVLARMRRLASVHAEQLQQLQQQQQQSEPLLLLRVLPGGHLAFERDVKESAFKLAFLLAAVAREQEVLQQQPVKQQLAASP